MYIRHNVCTFGLKSLCGDMLLIAVFKGFIQAHFLQQYIFYFISDIFIIFSFTWFSAVIIIKKPLQFHVAI